MERFSSKEVLAGVSARMFFIVLVPDVGHEVGEVRHALDAHGMGVTEPDGASRKGTICDSGFIFDVNQINIEGSEDLVLECCSLSGCSLSLQTD